jgi:hypothetical protein
MSVLGVSSPADLFHQLSQALEVLTDAAARVRLSVCLILTHHPYPPPGPFSLFSPTVHHIRLSYSLLRQAAYDKICAAKKHAEERNNKLDANRRKIKLGEPSNLCHLNKHFSQFHKTGYLG